MPWQWLTDLLVRLSTILTGQLCQYNSLVKGQLNRNHLVHHLQLQGYGTNADRCGDNMPLGTGNWKYLGKYLSIFGTTFWRKATEISPMELYPLLELFPWSWTDQHILWSIEYLIVVILFLCVWYFLNLCVFMCSIFSKFVQNLRPNSGLIGSPF